MGTPEILWEYERVLIEVAKKQMSTDLDHWLTFLQDRLQLFQPQHELKLSQDRNPEGGGVPRQISQAV